MAGHRFFVETYAGYLIVRQQGALESLQAAQAMQLSVDRVRKGRGVQRILFDNRETLPAPEEVRSAMWTWIRSSDLERVALLLASEMAVIRANMDALAVRTRLRAFAQETTAVAWLAGR